jgi:hypothetical protein
MKGAGIGIRLPDKALFSRLDPSILEFLRIINSRQAGSLQQTRRRFTRAALETTNSKESES